MDQRRLKVGDIVDDYCPRERRVTDHAVVAIVDEAIRQTRCTACDNEHPYKEARQPRPRRKATPAALYNEVLANVTDDATPVAAVAAEPDESEEAAVAPVVEEAATVEEATTEETPVREVHDEGPVHRPLIRATLPRPEGGTPASRQMPEFTVRQPGTRGRFREDFRSGGGGFRTTGRNGNNQGHGRPGRPGGSNQPARPRHGRPAPHKKRSR
jgi:hypothetical protein